MKDIFNRFVKWLGIFRDGNVIRQYIVNIQYKLKLPISNHTFRIQNLMNIFEAITKLARQLQMIIREFVCSLVNFCASFHEIESRKHHVK